MHIRNLLLSCAFAPMVVAAQTLPTMRVSSEVVPAGGTAQVKLLLTSPKPIITGNAAFDFSQVSFDSIDGVNLFSPTGDVSGAAVVSGGKFNLLFNSPGGTFGSNTDYPLMSFAVRLSSSCFPGQVMPVDIDPLASIWQSLTSSSEQFEYKQGSITVGGSVSISNVVPGGGVLPAGSSFSILGTGFTPKTSFSTRGLSLKSIQYVSPTEFRATLAKTLRLDGALIQAKNPDGSSDTYYSYLRGVSVGPSTRPLLTKTVAIFPMNPAFEAILPPTVSPVNPDYFTALALQNPGQVTTTITVETMSAAGSVTGTTQITLGPGQKIQREISEMFGAPPSVGSYLHIVATEPAQMMGLLGNDLNGTVSPVWVSVLNAPAAVPSGK